MMPFTNIDSVLLIHGFSVQTLNSWGVLPNLLQADGIKAESLYLSAFVSLDDYVSCDDLSQACEEQVTRLESRGLNLRRTCIIVHSTGALVVRRWMLNRRNSGRALPAYFISCAGANHGSTLSQLGRTELAYLFRGITEKTAVGKRVLEDLDYGSDFLRSLNREWLTAWNSATPLYEQSFCFSLGGTDHSFWQNHVVWQGHELGSDGTVRISGANLNYRFINVRPPYASALDIETMTQPCPHLIVETPQKKYSHTNQSANDTLGLVMTSAADAASTIVHAFGGRPEAISSVAYGILEGIESAGERPYLALSEAIAVTDVEKYKALQQRWADESAVWSAANPSDANATIVVSIADQRDRLVDDSLVLICDENGNVQSISQSILPNEPIRNEVSRSIVSFYVNYQQFEQVHPHRVHVEAQTDTPYVTYALTVDAEISGKDAGGNELHVIAPNEFTYVDVRVARDALGSFVFYDSACPTLRDILDSPYPPFVEGYVK